MQQQQQQKTALLHAEHSFFAGTAAVLQQGELLTRSSLQGVRTPENSTEVHERTEHRSSAAATRSNCDAAFSLSTKIIHFLKHSTESISSPSPSPSSLSPLLLFPLSFFFPSSFLSSSSVSCWLRLLHAELLAAVSPHEECETAAAAAAGISAMRRRKKDVFHTFCAKRAPRSSLKKRQVIHLNSRLQETRFSYLQQLRCFSVHSRGSSSCSAAAAGREGRCCC